MWIYEKKLQFPVKITKPNPRLASVIITQYGGRYSINYNKKFLQSQRCIYVGLKAWINMVW